jgi:hypothetical protein
VLSGPATMPRSRPWVEAMKKPSRAGSKPAKARSSKASKLKRNTVPKAAEHRSSAMQQIAGWLDNLGMSEYAERFAENDIDIAVLRHLTDQDLKELGVSLGHRRKMLAAIAEVTGAELTSLQPAWRRRKCRRGREPRWLDPGA